MPSPTSRGYRYPSSSSAANVPLDIQHLAEDVNADVQAIVAAMATDAEVTALLTPEAWHIVGSGGGEPNYQNSWIDPPGSEGVKFYKHLGRVYVAGTAARATASATVVFTLPAGYRPGFGCNFTGVAVSGAVHTVSIGADGTVTAGRTGSTWSTPVDALGFDGISFRAEA